MEQVRSPDMHVEPRYAPPSGKLLEAKLLRLQRRRERQLQRAETRSRLVAQQHVARRLPGCFLQEPLFLQEEWATQERLQAHHPEQGHRRQQRQTEEANHWSQQPGAAIVAAATAAATAETTADRTPGAATRSGALASRSLLRITCRSAVNRSDVEAWLDAAAAAVAVPAVLAAGTAAPASAPVSPSCSVSSPESFSDGGRENGYTDAALPPGKDNWEPQCIAPFRSARVASTLTTSASIQDSSPSLNATESAEAAEEEEASAAAGAALASEDAEYRPSLQVAMGLLRKHQRQRLRQWQRQQGEQQQQIGAHVAAVLGGGTGHREGGGSPPPSRAAIRADPWSSRFQSPAMPFSPPTPSPSSPLLLDCECLSPLSRGRSSQSVPAVSLAPSMLMSASQAQTAIHARSAGATLVLDSSSPDDASGSSASRAGSMHNGEVTCDSYDSKLHQQGRGCSAANARDLGQQAGLSKHRLSSLSFSEWNSSIGGRDAVLFQTASAVLTGAMVEHTDVEEAGASAEGTKTLQERALPKEHTPHKVDNKNVRTDDNEDTGCIEGCGHLHSLGMLALEHGSSSKSSTCCRCCRCFCCCSSKSCSSSIISSNSSSGRGSSSSSSSNSNIRSCNNRGSSTWSCIIEEDAADLEQATFVQDGRSMGAKPDPCTCSRSCGADPLATPQDSNVFPMGTMSSEEPGGQLIQLEKRKKQSLSFSEWKGKM